MVRLRVALLLCGALGCASETSPSPTAMRARAAAPEESRRSAPREAKRAAAAPPAIEPPAPVAPVALPAPDAAIATAAVQATADAGPQAPAEPSEALAVPPENTVRGAPPPVASAEEGARLLLAAIAADDPSRARPFFFPAAAFDLVKDMAVPGRYHRRLLAWYDEDVHLEHDRFTGHQDAAMERFQLGQCRWMDVRTEGNKLPYWSCRHNMIHARAGGRARTVEIHVLINWGQRWYVTHLGAIRR